MQNPSHQSESTRLFVLSTIVLSLLVLLILPTTASAQDSTGFHSLGLVHLPDQAWDVTVQGSYAYIACDDSGLCIVNITDVHAPTLASHLALNGWAQGVVVQNERAYVACRMGGIAVVNISTPNSPALITMYEPVPMNVRGVFVLDTVLYAVSDNYGLYTYSISNPDSLRPLGSIGLIGYRVKVVDTLAYVANGGAGLAIVNIRNPSSMSIVGTFPRAGCSFRNLTVLGHCVYCASYTGSSPGTWGIYEVDVTNPSAPSFLAGDTVVETSSGVNGPFGVSIVGTRLVATYFGVLKVYDVSNTNSLPIVSVYVTHIGIAWNVAVVDTMVYVADDTIGLHVMSYSPPVEALPNGGVEMPARFALGQNYPNPFNPTTTIRYSLSESAQVDLRVFDVNGREVATLAQERQNAGSYEVTFDAAKLPSGIYFYRMQTNRFTAVKKMVLVK